MNRCSICKFPLYETDAMTICPECDEQYHTECWESIGGCASYGCGKAAVPDEKPLAQNVGLGWGDEKQCPNCQRTITSSLLVCPVCKAELPYAEPMSRMEYREWLTFEENRRAKRAQLIGLFIGSLFVLPAPILGLFAGFTAYQNHEDMVGEYGAYLALGYGTTILGAGIALIMILLAIGL